MARRNAIGRDLERAARRAFDEERCRRSCFRRLRRWLRDTVAAVVMPGVR